MAILGAKDKGVVRKAATKSTYKPYVGTAGVSHSTAAYSKAVLDRYGPAIAQERNYTVIHNTSNNNKSSNKLPSWGNSGSGGGGGYDAAAAARAEAARQAAAAAAAKKAADKKAADATKKSVDALHGQIAALDKSKNQSIANIDKRLKEGRKLIDDAFGTIVGALDKNLSDNEKSEHDSSYLNLANRGRERMDILHEASLHGAGETDLLKTQAMTLRNWANNQSEVNRAFHDSQRSTNTEKTSLNATTKQNLHNLYGQSNVDKTSVYDDYYKSQADLWNQIFNIENSMHDNDQYTVRSPDAAKKVQTAVGSKFADPGIPDEVKNWAGADVQEKMLNNSQFGLQDYGKNQELKKPEGATLRKW